MQFRNLAVATAGLAIFAAAALAQVSGVEGIIKSADGKPVVGAIVKIHRTDMKGDWQTKPSDKKGHYIYNGLPYGATYTLTLVIDGKEADTVSGIRPSPGEIKDVPFDMKAAKADSAAKQAMAQKAIETGKIDDEMARNLTPEQKAALQKQIDQQVQAKKKSNALNDAFVAGMNAMNAAKADAADTSQAGKDKMAKDYDDAVAQFNKAGEMDPTQVAVWSNLAEAEMGIAGLKTGADHDAAMGKSLEAYQKALALKPDDASIHVNYGVALSKANKFPEMQAEFQKSAELDPTQACKSYFNLGAVLTNAGQTDQALAAFQKATTLDPNCADAYYQTGVTLMAKATTTPEGAIVPAPGTTEALQKYLALQPQGKYAQPAQELLTSLGTKVDMGYKDPNAKTTTKKKKQ